MFDHNFMLCIGVLGLVNCMDRHEVKQVLHFLFVLVYSALYIESVKHVCILHLGTYTLYLLLVNSTVSSTPMSPS